MLDGALFGVYEDDDPERRPPWLALAALVVVALVVAVLVWRAVNTDATLTVPTEQAEPTTSTTAGDRPAPTVEELRLLLPAGVEGCAPPPDELGEAPDRAVLRCAGPGAPATIDFSLHASVEARDDAFDFLAAVVDAPDQPGECALGRLGRHDYVGVEQLGQLACHRAAGRTHLLWTSDAGPLLAVASGDGGYAEHYAWWADLVDRTDAAFPTGEERSLLDRLPDSLLDDCDRDPDLSLTAGGDLAVTCHPEQSPAGEVSWIRFPGEEAIDGWWAARREQQPEVDDACAPDDYELGGSTGRVLCQRDPAGRALVAWARDDDHVGSVALGDDGVAVTDLLTWWERGGHLP